MIRSRRIVLAGAASLCLALAMAAALAAPAPKAPKARLPKLVELGSKTCIPCKAMAPILAELKREQAGKIDVEFLDVVKNPKSGEKYKIRLIPTQVFLDASGKEFFRHEGFYPEKEILAAFRKQGIALAPEKKDS